MHHDYFWYYVAIAAGALLLIFKVIRSRRKQDYYYHPGLAYYPAEVQDEYSFYDGQGGSQSQSRSHADFSFFERRFMNEIDNVLAACQRAEEEERWEDAEAYARSALRKTDRNLGRDHWYAVHALAWLGHLSYREGRYSEAREYFEKAVCIGKEWYVKVAPDLIRIEKDLAKCTDLLGF
ncbi:MAG: tetratricopeptide repeat protein [Candidatus Obscuribacterales bacterium]|nr:tetratricopeptide repeat protein [Candidatus Obscuribacterales bacterium]